MLLLALLFPWLLFLLSPFIPHFSSECLENLNEGKSINWPEVNESELIEDVFKCVVQINGKKRAIIDAKINITEKEMLEQIKNNSSIKKIMTNKTIKKTIFIPNRLINLIII